MLLHEWLCRQRMKNPKFRDVHFANQLGIGSNYLSQMKVGAVIVRPRLAELIESLTKGELKAKDLLKENGDRK
jgi:DNA-binding transcriptional regulator YdaS (Cro superfamily)